MLQHAVLNGLEELRDVIVGTLGNDVEVLQLSRGKAECEAISLDLPGISLLRTRYSAKHRWLDTGRDRCVHLVLASGTARGGATINGQPYETSNIYCRTEPVTVASVSEPGFEAFEILIQQNLADDLGLSLGQSAFLRAPEEDLERLRRFLDAILDPAAATETLDPQQRVTPEDVLAVVGGILDMPHARSLESEIGTKRRERIVAHAEAIMNDWDNEARLEVATLSRELGVPRRSIHHAFRHSLGMGPLAYFQLRRLHALRNSLLSADDDNTHIADIAHSHGFFEPGRMAGNYLKLFSELPSETLRRRR